METIALIESACQMVGHIGLIGEVMLVWTGLIGSR